MQGVFEILKKQQKKKNGKIKKTFSKKSWLRAWLKEARNRVRTLQRVLPFSHAGRRVPLQFVPDELQLWHGNGEHGQVHGHQENEEYEIDIDESRVLP